MHFNQLHRREFIMLLGGAAARRPVGRSRRARSSRRKSHGSVAS
jgi:hypothetical protein